MTKTTKTTTNKRLYDIRSAAATASDMAMVALCDAALIAHANLAHWHYQFARFGYRGSDADRRHAARLVIRCEDALAECMRPIDDALWHLGGQTTATRSTTGGIDIKVRYDDSDHYDW